MEYDSIKATTNFERVLVVDGLVHGFGDDGVTIESEYNLYDFQTYDGIPKYKVVDGVSVERTEEEIEEDRAERPEPSPSQAERINALETENKLLTAQVAALTDQNDFQEELIVELANIVYA